MSRQRTGRRTIALALASEEPPERKKTRREPTALNGLHAIIDAIIEKDPSIGTAAIWQRLADDHGTTVAYYTLRTYVISSPLTTKIPPRQLALPDQSLLPLQFPHPGRAQGRH
jgi:hypothetical protein